MKFQKSLLFCIYLCSLLYNINSLNLVKNLETSSISVTVDKKSNIEKTKLITQLGIDLKDVHHSLFLNKDSLERMSSENEGVPMPDWIKNKGADNIIQIKDPEKITALRIVDRYRKMFDYLDFSPVDDHISFEELEIAYINYNWPKIFKEEVNTIYCQKIIKKYDATKKNKLNFVEFTKYMEDLWENLDHHKNEKLFHWLDRDNDTSIQLSDMIFGISRVMLKDSNVKEVKNVFAIYDPKKTGKISQEDFVLAIINGYLKETLSDQKISDSFIKMG